VATIFILFFKYIDKIQILLYIMHMYIKTTKSKKFTYVQLVQGYREGSKVKHKVLVNLGRLDKLRKDDSWNGIIDKFSELMDLKNIVNMDNCRSTQIFNWGYLVYKKLWCKFELDKVLSNIRERGKTIFDLNSACFLMAIQHLLEPSSKLGTYNKQKKYLQHQEIELNHLYRSLDVLCQAKEEIEQHVFSVNCSLFKIKIDVVFYDVTTFHFESVRSDGLKNFGYSKNCKFNEVQVVLGMFIDNEGRPIGYELFPGNTFDSKTLDRALDAIEKRFGIRNVVIVADRGINSKLNLKHIIDKGYGYIVSSRIKSMGKEIKQKIFDKNGYSKLQDSDHSISYKIIDYANIYKIDKIKYELPEKLIITYSEKRASKDRADRQRLLDKADHLLSNKELIKSSNKRGGKKYLKEQGENVDWTLDVNAIARDEMFDGYYGIQTSDANLSVEKVLDAYRTLWKIEESFRVMKSTLEVRPIFHWTEDRIKGHFVACFLAFLLERTMEVELHSAGVTASTQDIRESLNSMQFTETDCKGKKYLLNAPVSELGLKILTALKIKSPPHSIPFERFSSEKFIA
jgi:transposase